MGAAAGQFNGCCINLLLILILTLRHKVGGDRCRSIVYSQSQLQRHTIPGMLAGVPQPRSAQAVSGLRRGGGRPYPNQIAPARHGFVPGCLLSRCMGVGRWPGARLALALGHGSCDLGRLAGNAVLFFCITQLPVMPPCSCSCCLLGLLSY